MDKIKHHAAGLKWLFTWLSCGFRHHKRCT